MARFSLSTALLFVGLLCLTVLHLVNAESSTHLRREVSTAERRLGSSTEVRELISVVQKGESSTGEMDHTLKDEDLLAVRDLTAENDDEELSTTLQADSTRNLQATTTTGAKVKTLPPPQAASSSTSATRAGSTTGSSTTRTGSTTSTTGNRNVATPTLPKTSDGVISQPLLFGFLGYTVACISISMYSIFKSG